MSRLDGGPVEVGGRARWFPADYAGARATFLERCAAAGADVTSLRHPTHTTPDGEPLHTDVAVLGDPGAPRAFVAMSGTHGVEGLGGSGCQSAFLAEGGAASLPDGVVLVLVHAVNPWGVAHLRRTNEDNVDLNRNFVRHGEEEPPPNPRYEELHPHVLPDDWDGPAHAAANQAIAAALVEWGGREVQEALTSGQYTRPDGLFYGGDRPTWSNRTWRAVLDRWVAGRTHVAFVDLHTGLGPYGVGEVIFRARYDGGGLERARRWYGDVTSSEEGSSVSTVIGGTTHSAVVDAAPDAEITTITLEFGTRSGRDVLSALRADNWLEHRGAPGSPVAAQIKAQLRDAFYPDEDGWKELVAARAVEVLGNGIAGLASA